MLAYVVKENTVLKYSHQKDYRIPTDSINAIPIKFFFDDTWGGYDSPICQVTKDGKTLNLPLDSDMVCMAPADLEIGIYHVSVFAYRGTEARNTVIAETFEVVKGGFVKDGLPAVPPPPDLYAQLLEQIDNRYKQTDDNVKALDKKFDDTVDQLNLDYEIFKSGVNVKITQFERDLGTKTKRLAIRCDNPMVNLTEDGATVNLHVDKVGITEDAVWEFSNGKKVADGTLDVTLNRDDFRAGSSEVLINIAENGSEDYQPNNRLTNNAKAGRVYFVSCYMKSVQNKNMRILVYDNGVFKDLTEQITLPIGEETKLYGMCTPENDNCVVYVQEGDGGDCLVKKSMLFDITDLINNYLFFNSQSDGNKASILDKGLPYIPAGESFTVGGTARNFVEKPFSSEGWEAGSYSSDFTITGNNVSFISNRTISGYSTINTGHVNLYDQNNSIKYKNNYFFFRINELQTDGGYQIGIGYFYVSNRNYGVNQLKEINNSQFSLGASTVSYGDSRSIIIDCSKGIDAIDLTSSGWYLKLLLLGFTTDEQVATWINEHVPTFEGEMPFPSFIPQLEVIVRAGTYYASTVIMVANSYYTAEQANVLFEKVSETGEGYIKYQNGVAICWGEIKNTPAGFNAWGSLFSAVHTINLNFPIPFVEIPSISITPISGGFTRWIVAINCSKNAIQNMEIVRATDTAPLELTYKYIAIGKWR